MIPLFLGLTLANLAALLTATILGYTSLERPDLKSWHLLAGAMSAMLCIGVHCVVFTYFIATAKWIQHAVLTRELDAQLARPTRSFKALAFPAALGCMAIVFITACFGAAHDALGVNRIWHHLLALASIGVNLGGAAIELSAIRKNGSLIDDILARIGAAALAKDATF